MAKSKISLPDGTNVDIEGSPEEIAKIIALYRDGERTDLGSSKSSNAAQKKKSKSTRDGPQLRIEQLIEDNFFSEKRKIGDVIEALAQNGWIYKSVNIGTPLKRLVNQGKLRRIKESGAWIYINP